MLGPTGTRHFGLRCMEVFLLLLQEELILDGQFLLKPFISTEVQWMSELSN